MLEGFLAPFLIGLLGSGHCVGMCGPLVLAAAQRHPSARELQVHQALYHLGKSGGYAVLGGLAGGIAGLIGMGLQEVLGGAQRLLSIGIGTALLVAGVGLLSGARWMEGYGIVAKLPGFRSALSYFIRRRTLGGTLGMGFVNGFLPCGLVYAALAMSAASGSVVEGALVMAAFGLGTAPALVLVGTVGHLAKPLWRDRLHRAAGLVLLAAGLPTILRATPLWHKIMQLFH